MQIAGVVEENETGKPEVAVALRASDVPSVCSLIGGKLMVWGCATTEKLWETWRAGGTLLFPACEATMVHVPVPIKLAFAPEIVQTAGVDEAKVTVNPELAVALSARVVPAVCVPIGAKVMVCAAWLRISTMLPEAVALPKLTTNASPCSSRARP